MRKTANFGLDSLTYVSSGLMQHFYMYSAEVLCFTKKKTNYRPNMKKTGCRAGSAKSSDHNYTKKTINKIVFLLFFFFKLVSILCVMYDERTLEKH